MKSKTLGLLAVGLLAGPMTTLAAPFTFQFQLPPWSSNSDVRLYGADAVIVVTVDNGSLSTLSQSYQNSQILQVAVDSGGTYENSWTAGDVLYNTNPLTVFISTDGAGEPLLNLDAVTNQRIAFSNGFGTWQFGAGPDFTQTWLENLPDFGSTQEAYHLGALRVLGKHVRVPEPGTLALLGLGLVGLGLSRRQTVARASAVAI